jgi:rhomboid family GlyGly-CTERM serine protease
MNLQELNQHSKYPWLLPVFLIVLCIVLHFMGFNQSLRFDRELIDNGHWWLLFSANFVHLGNNHLFLNLAGLGLIYFLLWPNFNTSTWALITIVSSIGVGLGLYWWHPELRWYVGFSGTLHGLIIAGAIADVFRFPVSGSILLMLVTAKLTWEQFFGAMPGSESVAGGHVVVDSHFYGAICGAVLAVLFISYKRFKAIRT